MSYPYDLGSYSRKIISTRNKTAKLWFDRALSWCYGYNHDQAVRCFKAAAKADPQCAMAQWGIAYAAGPNYNKQWKVFDPADLAPLAETFPQGDSAGAGVGEEGDTR